MRGQPKVFVSHASNDQERFVRGFSAKLREHGIDAWYAEWEIGPGDSVVTKIFEGGLKGSDCVIVVVSATSVQSAWVCKELNISVIKQIQDKIKLIPIIIDDCPIPEALRDILHVRIKDLGNYDIELRRIVDAIFGKTQKPPLGSPPEYIRSSSIPVPGLRPNDQHVLKLACQISLAKDIDLLEPSAIVAEAQTLGLSETQVQESVQILAEEGLLVISPGIGTYAVAVRISLRGFEIYCRSQVKDYRSIVRAVASEILNRGKNNSLQIADALGQPRLIVNHIMNGFSVRGFCKKSGQIATHISIYDISPRFQRAFEDCVIEPQ